MNPSPTNAQSCSRCSAPLPAGDPGATLTCAYCGQQVRRPREASAALAGMPVVIVGSKLEIGQRMEMTRAANQKLIDDERRRGVLIAIPIVIVAIAAATYAILVQGGYLR